MNSLLNADRPPVYCPGCAYEQVIRALNAAFAHMGLDGRQIALVSDIGCSGLFDTFFNTHALHGLHGRALTYATGLKMAQPALHVVVTMGDGGLGIGGAHFLSACRRNLDVTLLILNNFNFGMTGGQFSATTPPGADVGSGFLNRLEKPLDACRVARAAGAAYARRCSSYSKGLPAALEDAIRFEGFSVVDIWGVCTGRFTRKNRLTPRTIAAALAELPPAAGAIAENARKEFGRHYRKWSAGRHRQAAPVSVERRFSALNAGRQQILILGSAGQRVVTAGEILCLAGMSAGLNATQKNEYHVTVLRGPSISELILSPQTIGFTGIDRPDVILAVGQAGVARREAIFGHMRAEGIIIVADDVTVPATRAEIIGFDCKRLKIKPPERALAGLAVLAGLRRIISPPMLDYALTLKFNPPLWPAVRETVARVLG